MTEFATTKPTPTAQSKAAGYAKGRPFDLDDDASYRHWRAEKLIHLPAQHEELSVDVADPTAPNATEVQAIVAACLKYNFALFRFPARFWGRNEARAALKGFVTTFGLKDLESQRSADCDGIVALEVAEGAGVRGNAAATDAAGAGAGAKTGDKRAGYIPFTDRAIGWHTDGYYSFEGTDRMIRAMALYCVRSAIKGGETRLLDHELVYIRLRDRDPRHISALMHAEAMTIPENREPDGRFRPANVGPVFVVDPASGALVMRYTARKRNIAWRDDPATKAAVAALEDILHGESAAIALRLEPGLGVICNNVLHARSRFQNAEGKGDRGRLLYRVRCYDRIAGT